MQLLHSSNQCEPWMLHCKDPTDCAALILGTGTNKFVPTLELHMAIIPAHFWLY